MAIVAATAIATAALVLWVAKRVIEVVCDEVQDFVESAD